VNLTLWDIIEPLIPGRRKAKGREAASSRRSVARQGKPVSPPLRSPAAGPSMQDRYDRVVQEMLALHNIRVRKWRTSMTGMAWYVTYRDGTVSRLIESPRPKGPMSAAVFLHEVGHHAIGFNVYKPRCLEEYHAWRWSLEQMEALGLNVTDQVRLRMHQSLHYAVEKAKRRGIREVPSELAPFTSRPARSRRRRGAASA
jgi:hypothetical protein